MARLVEYSKLFISKALLVKSNKNPKKDSVVGAIMEQLRRKVTRKGSHDTKVSIGRCFSNNL